MACCDDSDSIVTEREGARPEALLFVTCGCPFLSLPLSEVRFDTSYIDGTRKLTWSKINIDGWLAKNKMKEQRERRLQLHNERTHPKSTAIALRLCILIAWKHCLLLLLFLLLDVDGELTDLLVNGRGLLLYRKLTQTPKGSSN